MAEKETGEELAITGNTPTNDVCPLTEEDEDKLLAEDDKEADDVIEGSEYEGVKKESKRKIKQYRRNSMLSRYKILAMCFDPMSEKKTMDSMNSLGYPISRRTLLRAKANPVFIDMWQKMMVPLCRGRIAKVADIQSTITNIMIDEKQSTADRLRACELMGKFLHAFDNTLNIKGQLNVLAGVITGVPAYDHDAMETVVTDAIHNRVEKEKADGTYYTKPIKQAEPNDGE